MATNMNWGGQRPDLTYSVSVPTTSSPGTPLNLDLYQSLMGQIPSFDYNMFNAADSMRSATDFASTRAPRQSLQGWQGYNAVNFSPETYRMLDQIDQLTRSGTLAQMLSGKTDQGLFQAGVVNPMQREFKNTTLPEIQDAYSGGAYGSGYWGGARQKATGEAQNKLNEQISGLRYQDYKAAQDRAVQTTALLPELAKTLNMREQQNAQNLERAMSVHYKNQGLKVDQFNQDMDYVKTLLNYNLGAERMALDERIATDQNLVDSRGQAASLQAALWGRQLENAQQVSDRNFLRSILAKKGI